MERLSKETSENAIDVYKTTIKAVEKHGDTDYSPVLDKVTVAFLEELKAYRDAEEQGLLPRFHLGDEFWTIGYSKASKSKVVMLQQKKDGTWKYRFCNEDSNTMDYEECELGKYFFATKEEAEQALEKMREE